MVTSKGKWVVVKGDKELVMKFGKFEKKLEVGTAETPRDLMTAGRQVAIDRIQEITNGTGNIISGFRIKNERLGGGQARWFLSNVEPYSLYVEKGYKGHQWNVLKSRSPGQTTAWLEMHPMVKSAVMNRGGFFYNKRLAVSQMKAKWADTGVRFMEHAYAHMVGKTPEQFKRMISTAAKQSGLKMSSGFAVSGE